MRGEHWIERHRSARVLDVAQRLGLAVFRSRGASGGSMACPACGAMRRHSKAGDKRGAAGVRREGNGWRCFQCDASGDALDAVAYALVGQRLRNADADQRTAVRLWLDEERPSPVSAPAVLPPPLEYPDGSELRVFFEGLIRADDDPQAAAYLRSRGVDPGEVEARTLGAVLAGSTTAPRFARLGRKSWSETGFRLILPLFDAQGRARSCLARAVTRTSSMKSTAPTGYARSGLVLANARGRAMLTTGQWPGHGVRRVVITEGEIDFLTAACEEPEQDAPVVLGVTSGSWTAELAARVPNGAQVVIATDNDAAGDGYAAKIADSLEARPITLLRWKAAS